MFTLEKYRDNEDKNQHSENYLALVKEFGTPNEIDFIERSNIIQKSKEFLHPLEVETRESIIAPYYQILVERGTPPINNLDSKKTKDSVSDGKESEGSAPDGIKGKMLLNSVSCGDPTPELDDEEDGDERLDPAIKPKVGGLDKDESFDVQGSTIEITDSTGGLIGRIIDRDDTLQPVAFSNIKLSALETMRYAESKGWKSVRLTGSDEFVKECMLYCIKNKIKPIISGDEQQKMLDSITKKQTLDDRKKTIKSKGISM